jgi:hypothetical protein
MDYAPEVTGNSPVAHYTHDPKTFDGFVFPTRRRVHGRAADGIADQSVASITLDVATVTVETTTPDRQIDRHPSSRTSPDTRRHPDAAANDETTPA